jgi:hypothetical protein
MYHHVGPFSICCLLCVCVQCVQVLGHFVPQLALFHNEKYGTSLTLQDFHSYNFCDVWGGVRHEVFLVTFVMYCLWLMLNVICRDLLGVFRPGTKQRPNVTNFLPVHTFVTSLRCPVPGRHWSGCGRNVKLIW